MIKRLILICALLGGAAPGWAATIRLALPSFSPGNADPFEGSSRTALLSLHAVFDTLGELGPDFRVVSALAIAWRNIEPTTWIVTLRPDVTFSNGERLSSEAVVQSYRFLQSREARQLVMAAEIQDLASVRAVDKLTVEFKTREPDPDFPRILALVPIIAPDYWRRVGHELYARAPVGTGPFIVDSWTNSRATLLAFKGSWRSPAVDRLELFNLPTQAARVQALIAGRVDIAVDVGLDSMELLTGRGYAINRHPVTSVDAMELNTLLPDSPFKDVRVRQALNYAIDRKTIAADILHDLVPPATQLVARANPDYDPTIAAYPFDPKKAKALLAEAGHPDGFSFTYEMSNSSSTELASVVQAVARNLAQIGVHMEVRPVPPAQILKRIRQGGWQAEAFSYGYGVLPTGDTLAAIRPDSCAATHPWYCDDSVMPLITQAHMASDEVKRRDIVHEILARTQQQSPSVLFFEPPGLDAVNPKIKNYTSSFGVIQYDRLAIGP